MGFLIIAHQVILNAAFNKSHLCFCGAQPLSAASLCKNVPGDLLMHAHKTWAIRLVKVEVEAQDHRSDEKTDGLGYFLALCNG